MIDIAAKYALESIGRMLTCSGCSSLVTPPILRFPCDHIFCKECLRCKEHQCPKCRTQGPAVEDEVLSEVACCFVNLDAALGNPVTCSASTSKVDEEDPCVSQRRDSDIVESGASPQSRNAVAQERSPNVSEDQTDNASCSFCRSTGAGRDSSQGGKILFFEKVGNRKIFAHEECALWAPNVYEDEQSVHGLKNVVNEVRRADKLRCRACGRRGAAIGCRVPECNASYHLPCARRSPATTFDEANYLLSCPNHPPGENFKRKAITHANGGSHSGNHYDDSTKSFKPSPVYDRWHKVMNWIIVGYYLSIKEKHMVKTLAECSGSEFHTSLSNTTTHIIFGDEALSHTNVVPGDPCGNPNFQSSVSIKWVEACLAEGSAVDEFDYMVEID